MSKHKDKEKHRSRSRSRSKDKERREKKKSKKSKRSKSRERKHRRSRSRSRSRSSSTERRRHRREERYEREREEREREEREREMERERLREIALEFKQSGAFSSITQQSQTFQPFQEQTMSMVTSFPTFNSFPIVSTAAPIIEMPQQQMQPKEMSQAYLEAVAASQRIAASKNFTEMLSCNNSNDSTSNGPTSNSGSNSRDGEREAARQRKKKSRWGGSENDKTFIPGMPTVLPSSLDSHQQEAYLVQLQIEEISRKLRTGELGIASVEERSPSPEPIYSSDGKRLNTREFRTRKRLEEQRHQLILRMQCMNPDFKPPSDYKAPVVRVSDKVLIPQEEHPDINFVGLLIGPRGNTLKAMEKETGAKIIIRGKGSVKEGKVGRKDGQPLPGEDEPLHAFITAANADCVKKAVEKINEVIKQGIEVPEGHNDLRRMQLRELAQLNGTLRETDGPRCTNCGSNEHKSWLCPDKPNVTNNIVCSSCGGAGHIAKDCKAKRPGQGGPPVVSTNSQAKIDEEYLSLMAELGEGPPASKSKDSDSTQQSNSAPSNRNQFSIFERQGPLKAIAAPNPIQQPPPRMPQPPNWNGQPPMPVPPLPPGGTFAMPPPPIRPPMWNQQPQIPGTDLPPVPPPSGGNSFPPPPPPGTSNWSAPLPPPTQQYPWSNGSNFEPNFVPPLPAVPPPPPPPPGS